MAGANENGTTDSNAELVSQVSDLTVTGENASGAPDLAERSLLQKVIRKGNFLVNY